MKCCEQPENRDVIEDRDGKRVEVCVVCQCKHIVVKFQAFSLGKEVQQSETDKGTSWH